MELLRAEPPGTLGGLPVVGIDDLASGAAGLPPTEGLRYRLDGAARAQGPARVVVRPSGTEPKLKCYLEVVVPVDTDVGEARTVARGQLAAIREDLSTALGL